MRCPNCATYSATRIGIANLLMGMTITDRYAYYIRHIKQSVQGFQEHMPRKIGITFDNA